VLLRGRLLVDDGAFVGEEGRGQFLARKPSRPVVGTR